jgi:hypothetical protein
MACAPNTEIRWSDVYAIAQRIDALAVTLSTPSYEKLVDVTDMPFKFPDLVDFSGAIRFAVGPGNTTVTDQHLSDGVMLTAPHVLDSVLDEMGKNEDLFLVVEEDDCWCKTIFEIDTNPGVPRVKEVSELGCCQSMFVPQPGDLLNYGQHIIPAGYAGQYAVNGNPEEGALWQVRAACVSETVDSGYKFQTVEKESPLTDCTREIEEAKFTWPMRKTYMDKMIEKLKFILECANSGGAKEDEIKTGNPDPEFEYVWEGCEVTICALVKDRVERGVMDYSTAGCVSQGCNSLSPPEEPTAYPWNSPTCGGQNCESNGPKFYCRTLEDLEAILTIAESGLRPYNPPTVVCGRCTCSVSIEYEGRFGSAETCLGQYSAFLFFEKRFQIFSYTRLTGPEEGTSSCTSTIITTYNTGVRNLECQDGPLPTDGCSSSEEVINPSCPPDDGEVWVVDYEENSTVFSPPSYIADAQGAYNDCPDNAPGGASSAIYFDGYGEAYVSSFRWRVRVEGEWNCESPPPYFTAHLKRKTAVFNTNTGSLTEGETSVTASVTWDAGEKTLVSPWVAEAIPATVSRGIHSSVWMEYTSPDSVRCPNPCTEL